MMDFINTALAQGGAQGVGSIVSSAGSGAAIMNILFMVGLFAIFYFLLIRPQQKQAKTHKEMIDNLQRDDTVVTTGGLIGRIHRVDDDMIIMEVGEVEVSPRVFKPVRIKVRKGMVGSVATKAGITPPVDPQTDKK